MVDDNNEEVEEEHAVKVYNKDVLKKKIFNYHDEQGLVRMKRQLDQVYHEIDIWEKLQHKNVVMIFQLIDEADS